MVKTIIRRGRRVKVQPKNICKSCGKEMRDEIFSIGFKDNSEVKTRYVCDHCSRNKC